MSRAVGGKDEPVRYRITAVVDDGDAALRLVERLSLAGVDGVDLRVVHPTASSRLSRRRDRAIDARLMRRLATRAATGAAVGLVIALVVTMGLRLVVDGFVPASWLVAGVVASGMVGLLTVPVMAPAWESAGAPGPSVRRIVIEPVPTDRLEHVRELVNERAQWVEVEPINRA